MKLKGSRRIPLRRAGMSRKAVNLYVCPAGFIHKAFLARMNVDVFVVVPLPAPAAVYAPIFVEGTDAQDAPPGGTAIGFASVILLSPV